MTDTNDALSVQVTVPNDLGLHARPAAMIAALAQQAGSPVWIIKDDETVDATSILDILTLACAKGTRLTLKAENSADTGILKRIAELIERGFEEDV